MDEQERDALQDAVQKLTQQLVASQRTIASLQAANRVLVNEVALLRAHIAGDLHLDDAHGGGKRVKL